MYPRNAASPERIAIGAVVQISDGAIQTTGVSVSVQPQGGSEAAGGGTLAFNTGGEALYTPTQAETNYTSFIVTVYKTGCFPISQTVVTTANAVPGRVDVGSVAGAAQDAVNLGAGITDIKGPNFSATTDSLEKIRDRVDTIGSSASSPAADKVYTLSWTRVVGDDDGGSSGDTTTVNGVSFVTGEITGTTLLEVNGTVTVDDAQETPMALKLWAQYTGTGGHFLEVRAYNYTDATWEPLGTITNTAAITPFTFNLSAQHINRTTRAVAVKIIHGTATGNPAHAFAIDKALLLASSAVTVLTAPDIADAVWDEIVSPSNHNVKNSAAYKLWRMSETMIWTGLATGGTANSISLPEGDSAEAAGAYDPAMVYIIAGTGVGQSRLCVQYSGHPDHVLVVDRDWKVVPDATSEVIIMAHPGREHVNEGRAQGGTIGTITLNANASASDDAYNAQVVFLRSGTGQDQARRVLDYDGTTKVAVVSRDWAVIPDATTGYVMLPSGAISDNCIGRAVWSDLIGEYVAIEGSASQILVQARDSSILSQTTISEGLFALFQGCKDWGAIVSASFTGTMETGGYLTLHYTASIGSSGGDVIGSFDENKIWTTDPGYDSGNSKNAILRIDAGNLATSGVFSVVYVSLLDGQQHTWSVRIPACLSWDECWNVLPDGRLRPCDSGALTHSFNNEPLIKDLLYAGYVRCDGWSEGTDPVVLISSTGVNMNETAQQKYCIQYICLDDPEYNETMIGYWSTWGGWEQRLSGTIPPNSILCFCPDRGGPLFEQAVSIPPRMLQIIPQTPNLSDSGRVKPLYVGEMTHQFNSTTKYCFDSFGVMRPLNLFSTPASSGGGVDPELIEALITVLGQLASHQYHPGTVVNPVEVTNEDITIFCNTDYTGMRFNVGAQWATYLNEENAEVWFTVMSGNTRLIDVQGTIEDANTGALLLDLTAAQTNVKQGTFGWQFLCRRSTSAGDPPVVTVKRRMMMEGKVYMKPSYKA